MTRRREEKKGGGREEQEGRDGRGRGREGKEEKSRKEVWEERRINGRRGKKLTEKEE